MRSAERRARSRLRPRNEAKRVVVGNRQRSATRNRQAMTRRMCPPPLDSTVGGYMTSCADPSIPHVACVRRRIDRCDICYAFAPRAAEDEVKVSTRKGRCTRREKNTNLFFVHSTGFIRLSSTYIYVFSIHRMIRGRVRLSHGHPYASSIKHLYQFPFVSTTP